MDYRVVGCRLCTMGRGPWAVDRRLWAMGRGLGVL